MKDSLLEQVRRAVIEALYPEPGSEFAKSYLARAEPFGLAEVLRAINEQFKFSSTGEGWRANYELVAPTYENGKYIRDARWNLALSLDDQEEPVIAFLHKILYGV